MNSDLPVVDDTKIWNAWLGLYNTPAISVALELEVFEHLQVPANVNELAASTGYSVRGLSALLGMLKNLDLLDRRQGKYQLNETSKAYLLQSSPYFWGPFFKRTAESLPMHKLLLDNVKDDATSEVRSTEGWESGHIDEEMAESITDFMHCHSIAPAVGMSQSCDFSSVQRLLDVGGGSGCYAIAVARANSQLQATVMDLPTICKVAEGYISRGEVADRVDAQAVDMFRHDWPAGYDAHFFANVFHDWSMETCEELAASSFAALESGGKIYLQELLLDDSGDGPTPAIAFSLLMCMGTKGQQFTFEQLKNILEKVGFTDITAQRSYGHYSLVSGCKL